MEDIIRVVSERTGLPADKAKDGCGFSDLIPEG